MTTSPARHPSRPRPRPRPIPMPDRPYLNAVPDWEPGDRIYVSCGNTPRPLFSLISEDANEAFWFVYSAAHQLPDDPYNTDAKCARCLVSWSYTPPPPPAPPTPTPDTHLCWSCGDDFMDATRAAHPTHSQIDATLLSRCDYHCIARIFTLFPEHYDPDLDPTARLSQAVDDVLAHQSGRI